jgi:hypothetical protein
MSAKSRKPISARRRFEIFKRDRFTCAYCGATPPGALLHVDHINPVALGGTNEPENLITACERCNAGKSSVPLTAVPKSLRERAEEVAEREAQIAGFAKVMRDAIERVEADVWTVAEILQPGAREGYSTAKFNSIKGFIKRLPIHEVVEAAEIAVSRKKSGTVDQFKYFCGVCWKKVKQANG